MLMAQVARGSVPSGQDGMSRYMEEETSPEESVLQELERVTSQVGLVIIKNKH